MSLVPSSHNLVGRLHTGGGYIVNPLSGHADLLSSAEIDAVESGHWPDTEAMAERGYLVDPAEEGARLRAAYLDHLDARETDEVQLLFAVSYACNFACDYCFQDDYGASPRGPTPEVVDAFFRFIDTRLAGRSAYLTLFGGEPLLPAKHVRDGVAALIDGANARGLEVAVVTNGSHLVDAVETLSKASIREIQITLDGPRAVHDARRPLKGGAGTFDAVVAGVDEALARSWPVNLRVVVDRDNLPALPELARFAIEKGWTRHPKFKTQLGRNYELHGCQVRGGRLYTRLELYADLAALITRHPEVLELHKPAFHVARFLFDESALPDPLFDACPGAKTEWAFDALGRVYPCTANVGKPGEAIGTYHPELRLDEDEVERWEDRDVMAIEACSSCSARLVCGGGCAEVARNATGELHAPDCRPVGDILQLGMNVYFARE